jgi:hypothetical protein
MPSRTTKRIFWAVIRMEWLDVVTNYVSWLDDKNQGIILKIPSF